MAATHKQPLTNPKKNILIVSQTFPPEPGIGGRRWAKFAKFLHRAGVNTHVLSRRAGFTGERSLWTDDVNALDPHNLHHYTDGYPEVLRKTTLSFFDKLKYRIALKTVQWLTKGNPYDRAAFIEGRFKRKLNAIINRFNITNVVVSGPSFNLLYYAADLKKQRNDFKLIVDFRDGWTWDTRYGMGIINDLRKKEERRKEARVIEHADLIMTPSEFHFEHLCRLYPTQTAKMMVTPHAFDRDDLPTPDTFKAKGNYYIYGGSLYEHLEPVFKALNRSFHALAPRTVEIRLYLSNPDKLAHYMQYIDEAFHSYFINASQLTPKEFYREVSGAKAFLLWSGVPTLITSKVFEILSCRTPILTIGHDGELPRYLEAHRMGVHFDADGFCFSRAEDIFEALDGFHDGHVFPDYEHLVATLIKSLD